MATRNSVDQEKKIKIEKYLRKLSKKKYSDADIKNTEEKAESSYKNRLETVNKFVDI